MRRFLVVLVFIGIVFLTSPLSVANAYYTNMSASVVIGQPNFTTGSSNQGSSTPTANTLSTPRNVTIIGGKMIVPDFSNNRVVIYNRVPTSNNASADIVIGQTDMFSNSTNQGGSVNVNTLSGPESVATDGTRLILSDFTNNRVLIYNTLPTSNNASADVVIGQVDFTHNSANQGGSITAATIKQPVGLSVDSSGKLYVVDSGNSRVLIYNSIPTSNGVSADVAVGQVDFTHGFQNQGIGSPFANTLSSPFGVSANNGKLLIADINNHRVLVYNSIPASNNASADVVIGQPKFTTRGVNEGLSSPDAFTLRGAQGVDYVNGRVFIEDTNNQRVLIFNSLPTVNNASADIVIGQANFTLGSDNGISANTIGVSNFVNTIGDTIYMTDSGNHRILLFKNTTITPNINLTSSPTNLNTGRYRLTGNVYMNNNGGTYGLQTLSADLNGTGYGLVTFPGGRTDTGGNSTYDFNYDFDPSVGGGSINNLTIKLLASTTNADTNTLFYFLPFNFKSFNVSSTKLQTFTFSVNKDQLQKVKDNLDHFEVWYKPNTTKGTWTNYISNISKAQVDNNGLVSYNKTTNLTKFIGSYIFKVTAVDNWGNKEDSNYLYIAGTTPIALTSYPSFGKTFTPVPSPITQSLVPSTSIPLPTNTPEEVVPSNTADRILNNQNPTSSTTSNNLGKIVLGVIIFLLLSFLLLFLKRRRKKENQA